MNYRSLDLPNPGIESRSPALQADSLPLEPQGNPTINKWDLIKLKSFAQQKTKQNKKKNQPSTDQKDNLLNGRKYLQMI